MTPHQSLGATCRDALAERIATEPTAEPDPDIHLSRPTAAGDALAWVRDTIAQRDEQCPLAEVLDRTGIVDIDPAPPILWIRGAEDQIFSGGSFFDAGYLGKVSERRGWPGEDVYLPQPMVTQTRDVFEDYADAGSEYKEVVVEDAGHSPHIQQHDEVLHALTAHLGE